MVAWAFDNGSTSAAGNVTTLLTEQSAGNWLPARRIAYYKFGQWTQTDLAWDGATALDDQDFRWGYYFGGAHTTGSAGLADRGGVIYSSSAGGSYDSFIGQRIPLPEVNSGYSSLVTDTGNRVDGLTQWLGNMSDGEMVGLTAAAAVVLAPALLYGGLAIGGGGVAYVGSQAGIAGVETAVEAGVSGLFGDGFSAGDWGRTFGKNFGINLLTGGLAKVGKVRHLRHIPKAFARGGTKVGGAYLAKHAGAFGLRQGVEIAGETVYDVGVRDQAFGSSLLYNSIGSIGGEFTAYGAGRALRRASRGAARHAAAAYSNAGRAARATMHRFGVNISDPSGAVNRIISMSPAALTAARKWTQGVTSNARAMAKIVQKTKFRRDVLHSAWGTVWGEVLRNGSDYTMMRLAY